MELESTLFRVHERLLNSDITKICIKFLGLFLASLISLFIPKAFH